MHALKPHSNAVYSNWLLSDYFEDVEENIKPPISFLIRFIIPYCLKQDNYGSLNADCQGK